MASFPSDRSISFEEAYQTSEAECIEVFRQRIDPITMQASIDAGRIEYDARDAEVCLDAMEALTCDAFWGGSAMLPPECDTAFVGTVAVGDFCTLDDDCAEVGSLSQSAARFRPAADVMDSLHQQCDSRRG